MYLKRNSSFINNLFLVTISLTFLLLTISNLIYLIVLIPYLIYIFIHIKNKQISIIIIICMSLLLINYLYLEHTFNKHEENVVIKVKVIEKDEKKLICSIGINKAYVYTNDYEIGDVLIIKGKNKDINTNNLNNFDYTNYLKLKRIIYYIEPKEIIYLKHTNTIYKVKYYVYNYLEKYINDTDSLALVKGLVLNDKSMFSSSFNEALKENGIMHLFAISGLHISLIIMIFKKILEFFNLKENKANIIIIIFLFIYLVITNFSSSILRSSLVFLFSLINKYLFKSIFSSLDILSAVFIILVIINPYFGFEIGFILSFLVSFVIINVSQYISSKGKFSQVLYMSIASNIFTLPIIININYKINLLSVFLNVLYISLVSSIILPLTFIVVIFPIFMFLYKYIIKSFIYLVEYSSMFSINLYLPHMKPLIIIIYFCLIYIIIKLNNKTRYMFVGILIIFLLGLSNQYIFYKGKSVDFLYLNDGEASLIRDDYVNILIDTGDGYNNEVLGYLLSKGIKKLDLVVITHDHNDHYGGLENIKKEIYVKEIVCSKYNYASYTYYKNVRRMKVDEEYKNKDVSFYVLSPNIYKEEENSNSLVLYLSLLDTNILFMGDSTIQEEDLILEKLNKKQVDIYKVAHHGSNTSNSFEFIKKINAKDAIIMVPYKWKDKLPNNDVLNNLYKNNMNVYTTLDYGSIYFDIKKKKYSYKNNN